MKKLILVAVAATIVSGPASANGVTFTIFGQGVTVSSGSDSVNVCGYKDSKGGCINIPKGNK